MSDKRERGTIEEAARESLESLGHHHLAHSQHAAPATVRGDGYPRQLQDEAGTVGEVESLLQVQSQFVVHCDLV